MRLCSLSDGDRNFTAVKNGDTWIDLSVAAPDLPHELAAILALGERGLQRAAAAARQATGSASLRADSMHWRPLIDNPGKIICLGLNYADHAAESRQARPSYPVFFGRFASSLTGHRQPILAPTCSSQLDYEAELAVVIGRRGRALTKQDAYSFVAGYSVFNDGSIRDYQMKTGQWTIGKNFDGTGAFGPELVTTDELPEGAKGLRIQTRLNGQVLQDANTRDMIFDVGDTILLLSEVMTLSPGDVIVMGTPSGVGMARSPQIFMKPGDICEVEIESIGVLRNAVESLGQRVPGKPS
jgi:acylpyruvate hydrolase